MALMQKSISSVIRVNIWKMSAEIRFSLTSSGQSIESTGVSIGPLIFTVQYPSELGN